MIDKKKNTGKKIGGTENIPHLMTPLRATSMFQITFNVCRQGN